MEHVVGGDIHPHCMNCIKFKKCNTKPEDGVSCEIISCSLNCGMMFHACKKAEHLPLCPNEKVHCYNADSGCPLKMQRKMLGKHLATCPASVVHCTMEWNRWRLDASSKEKLLLYTSMGKSQQRPLDIALALRDQRMLKWHTSSDHLQKTIRTDFWYYPQRIYPVKPSISVQGRGQERAGSMTVTKNTSNDSLEEVSTFNQSSPVYTCCNGHNSADQETMANEICFESNVIPNGYVSDKDETNHVEDVRRHVPHTSPSAQSEKHRKSSLSNNQEERRVMEEEDSEIPESFGNQYSSERKRKHESDARNSTECYNGSTSDGEATELNDCDNWEKLTSEKSLSGADEFDENFVNAILSCPTRYLGLGPCIESPAKNYVYTFLCSQEFRRDEYPWHYKNVHSDIHGGLNGWLQERCPLAQYGCTFSRQQLNPLPKGSKIVYNEILESFGIAPPSPHPENKESFSDCGSLGLSNLPFEVLQHIARFLDSFSLSNLSNVSQLMQAVCQSLLVTRGIVTISWERRKENNVVKWKDTGKKWSFSSHFTPVHNWIFDDGSNMANHLKSCKFNNRIKKTEPYFLPMGNERCWYLFEKLKQSAQSWSSENLTTKL